jgi:trans-2,3-dihydro-3-hydroxyanthranilate isomerase
VSASGLPVTIVRACLRDGRGGSPTAVLDEMPLSDAERCGIPARTGASHAVFVSVDAGQDRPVVSLRFFTAGGELPACGHGTVAALALLAERSGVPDHRVTLRAAGRTFEGRAVRGPDGYRTAFDPGPVTLREPTRPEREDVLAALRTAPDTLAPGLRAASVGRWRLLVPLRSRSALADLAPDLDRLRAACLRTGLLGAYAYSVPAADGRVAARMFAPAIGVPEDIANANSTACLAAHLLDQGVTGLRADMGDALGSPATITATAARGPAGPYVSVGGTALIGPARTVAPATARG